MQSYFQDKYINDGIENGYSVGYVSTEYFALGVYVLDAIYSIITKYFDDFYMKEDGYSLDNYVNNEYSIKEVYVQ